MKKTAVFLFIIVISVLLMSCDFGNRTPDVPHYNHEETESFDYSNCNAVISGCMLILTDNSLNEYYYISGKVYKLKDGKYPEKGILSSSDYEVIDPEVLNVKFREIKLFFYASDQWYESNERKVEWEKVPAVLSGPCSNFVSCEKTVIYKSYYYPEDKVTDNEQPAYNKLKGYIGTINFDGIQDYENYKYNSFDLTYRQKIKNKHGLCHLIEENTLNLRDLFRYFPEVCF